MQIISRILQSSVFIEGDVNAKSTSIFPIFIHRQCQQAAAGSQCSHKGLLHFWFSSFWTRKCNNSNNITMLENRQRCIVSMSTEHTKLCLELAISGFLKWVNHWKDILRLESAAPSHECHHEYLPHIESLLRSQTSSGWYISGRHTLVVGPAAVYLWRFLWWMSAFYPLVCFVKYSNNQEDEKGNVFKIIYPFTQHRAAELKIPWQMRNSQKWVWTKGAP